MILLEIRDFTIGYSNLSIGNYRFFITYNVFFITIIITYSTRQIN